MPDPQSVQLQAARAVLADLMTVSHYAELEDRLAAVERRLRDQPAAPDTAEGRSAAARPQE